MAMAATEIEALIRGAMPDAVIEITDLRGDGDHYAARVVSRAFTGLSRVRQHQAVYKALGAAWGANCMRCSWKRPRRQETINE